MDFRFTATFEAAYESLPDNEATLVDSVILRLLREHATAWARQNRVVGELNDAWIVTFHHRDSQFSLYWNYLDEETLVLLVLARA